MEINFKTLKNNDRANIAKGIKNLYNLETIIFDNIILDFENRILRVPNTNYVLQFDSVVCIDFNKYNEDK